MRTGRALGGTPQLAAAGGGGGASVDSSQRWAPAPHRQHTCPAGAPVSVPTFRGRPARAALLWLPGCTAIGPGVAPWRERAERYCSRNEGHVGGGSASKGPPRWPARCTLAAVRGEVPGLSCWQFATWSRPASRVPPPPLPLGGALVRPWRPLGAMPAGGPGQGEDLCVPSPAPA